MAKNSKAYSAEWYKQMKEKDPSWYEQRKKDNVERGKKKYWDIKNSLLKERAIELSRMTNVDDIVAYLKENFMVRRK